MKFLLKLFRFLGHRHEEIIDGVSQREGEWDGVHVCKHCGLKLCRMYVRNGRNGWAGIYEDLCGTPRGLWCFADPDQSNDYGGHHRVVTIHVPGGQQGMLQY